MLADYKPKENTNLNHEKKLRDVWQKCHEIFNSISFGVKN